MDYATKIEQLLARLASLPGAAVAFSGGVDSTMLLHAAQAALGARVLAVTADSPSYPRAELLEARELARGLGVRHLVVPTFELQRGGYQANAPDRCFFCKDELFEVMAAALRQAACSDWPMLYGAIADDLGDHRPGQRAAQQRRVLAPLQDLGITKEEVRRYSRAVGLPTADKPAFACLSSRVQHGIAIDAALLGRIEQAEAFLRERGFRVFRVRHHGETARLELGQQEIARAAGPDREAIAACLRGLGWRYVTLDLEGYRSGSMNPAATSGPVLGV
jgi:uncharacterized protein